MNIFRFFEEEFKSIVHDMKSAGDLPADLDTSRVVFELPREASHGDLACNAAMVLAKAAGMKPRDLAEAFSVKIGEIAGVTSIEIAGPGFINIRVEPRLWAQEIDDIIAAGTDYGRNDSGASQPVNVEYVSANPTGPLHAAHARGAARAVQVERRGRGEVEVEHGVDLWEIKAARGKVGAEDNATDDQVSAFVQSAESALYSCEPHRTTFRDGRRVIARSSRCSAIAAHQ